MCIHQDWHIKWLVNKNYGHWVPLGQHDSDWSHDLATLTFDLGGPGDCGWCGSSSSICTPSLKFVGLAVRKIWHMMSVSINGLVTLNFDLLTLKLVCNSHLRCRTILRNLGMLGLWVLKLFAMYAMDGQTDGHTKATLISPSLMGRGHNEQKTRVVKTMLVQQWATWWNGLTETCAVTLVSQTCQLKQVRSFFLQTVPQLLNTNV